MAGFAGLMLSDYGGMFSLGLAMLIGVATCAVASLVVLPAILVLLGRAK
jgi:predicted RND superfamily exporter protein